MRKLNTWRLLVIFVLNKFSRAIISWEAAIKPATTNVAHCRIRIAYVFIRIVAHASHTYRTHVAHISQTGRKRIANGSHTCRIRIAHLSHTYRTHRTHFWLSLRHGTMSSALFQVRRLNFVLQTCLINSLNARDTYCTCYWTFKHTFSVHSKLKIYPCLEISL